MRRRRPIGKGKTDKEKGRTSLHDGELQSPDDHVDGFEEEWVEADGAPLLDWTLIDEVSLPLLERGIGAFDVLQRALPTVVFVRIERIVPAEQTINQRHNNNEGEEDARETDDHPTSLDRRQRSPTAASTISDVRALKLFRIAQLQLRHLLRTQRQLLDALDRHRHTHIRARRERWRDTKAFGTAAYQHASKAKTSREGAEGACSETDESSTLFKCNDCGKIFVDGCFLADHLRRRHAKDFISGSKR